jgi:hypothetical protein
VPPIIPPAAYRGTPCHRVLPAGIELYRVHERKYPGTAFVPKAHLADPHFGGGRFDPTAADPYPYLYAAFSPATALAERLLRDLAFDDQGERILLRKSLQGRRVSGVRLASDLKLVALTTGPELAAVSQDGWLVRSEAGDYGQTRRWAHWLRAQASWAQGFVWPSKQDVHEEAVILFGDRCHPGDLQPGDFKPRDLASDDGRAWLRDVLAEYKVTIGRPARQPA